MSVNQVLIFKFHASQCEKFTNVFMFLRKNVRLLKYCLFALEQQKHHYIRRICYIFHVLAQTFENTIYNFDYFSFVFILTFIIKDDKYNDLEGQRIKWRNFSSTREKTF